MSPADLAALKSRVETALAESVKEVGETDQATVVSRYVFPIDRAWALANIEDTRILLTDHAARSMGGKDVAVTVSDEGIVLVSNSAAKVPVDND